MNSLRNINSPVFAHAFDNLIDMVTDVMRRTSSESTVGDEYTHLRHDYEERMARTCFWCCKEYRVHRGFDGKCPDRDQIFLASHGPCEMWVGGGETREDAMPCNLDGRYVIHLGEKVSDHFEGYVCDKCRVNL